jgi:hypothetical protein
MRKLLVLLLALIGIVAGGCIIQFSTLYVDDVSRTHFVGLASNLTNADVVSASVEVRFYDSSNNLLATKSVSPCTRTLQAHQSSPVESIIPAGVTVKRAETVVHPQTFGEKMVPDFDIKNISFEKDGTVAHLKGEVTNNDNEAFYAVQVCAAFYDDDDDVVRVGSDYLDLTTLSEDKTGEFDIEIEDWTADAEQYELWVDATTRSPKDVTAPVVEGPDDIPGLATATPTATPTPTSTPTPTATTPPP